jgi:hypothetical protein
MDLGFSATGKDPIQLEQHKYLYLCHPLASMLQKPIHMSNEAHKALVKYVGGPVRK